LGEVYFYHLTRQSINEALVPLLKKCLDNNWRVVVRGTDLKLLEALDETLWEGPGNEFLPHGLLGGLMTQINRYCLFLKAKWYHYMIV